MVNIHLQHLHQVRVHRHLTLSSSLPSLCCLSPPSLTPCHFQAWVANFERPRMNANSLLASSTGLSPYLRFGCLSCRLFYFKLTDLFRKVSVGCLLLLLSLLCCHKKIAEYRTFRTLSCISQKMRHEGEKKKHIYAAQHNELHFLGGKCILQNPRPRTDISSGDLFSHCE